MAAAAKPLQIASLLLLLFVALSGSARDSAPKWIRVNSSHFSVLTDTDPSKARPAIVAFEQMSTEFGDLLSRDTVHRPAPLEIIAFKTNDEYARVAPAGESAPGFFLSDGDRNFAVLDLSREESWRAVAKSFGMMLLNGNYPPAQPWFDEGFTQYFASFRPGDHKLEVGNDPSGGRFTALLSKENWLSSKDLFSYQAAPTDLFRAQAWITMHYLINKDKLSETGGYFGLVKMQKTPVEQAIQKAYSMSADQFGQAIKDYFQALAPKLTANTAATSTVTDSEVIGASALDVKPGDAQAAIAEMALRVPGRQPFALAEIQTIINDPKTDNAIAHRALAWDDMQQHKFDDAAAQLDLAFKLDQHDPWVRYYLSSLRYQRSDKGKLPIRGLPNMMQDLRLVLDWDPEFAEAYNLLGLARLEGGGVNAAMESMHAAIQLGPRVERYQLNMVNIYISGKKWDAATAMLERLTQSPDPEIAAAAQKKVEDLPMLKKYGRVPETGTSGPAPGAPEAKEVASIGPSVVDSDQIEVSAAEALPPPPDKRPIQYAKGKLLSVDCSHAPVALLTVSTGAKKMVLRTEDYKSLVVVGADGLSCSWTNRAISANYKPGGKSDGDLVSIEVR